MRVSLIGQTVLVLTLTPAPIFACKCVAPPPDAPHGRLLWDATRKADVVFEGKVESAEPKWRLIDAQAGEVIPADIEESEAAVQVTFEVLRNYSEVNEKYLILHLLHLRIRRFSLPQSAPAISRKLRLFRCLQPLCPQLFAPFLCFQ